MNIQELYGSRLPDVELLLFEDEAGDDVEHGLADGSAQLVVLQQVLRPVLPLVPVHLEQGVAGIQL